MPDSIGVNLQGAEITLRGQFSTAVVDHDGSEGVLSAQKCFLGFEQVAHLRPPGLEL